MSDTPTTPVRPAGAPATLNPIVAANNQRIASVAKPAGPGMPPPGYMYKPGVVPPLLVPIKKIYDVDLADAVFALVMVAIGFLFWNWIWPHNVLYATGLLMMAPSITVPIYFAMALVCSFVYFHIRKVHLTWVAVTGAVAIMLLALPFALYDTTPLHVLAGIALVITYIVWHGYAAGTAVTARLGLTTVSDVVNQCLVVPFGNFGAWFAGIRSLIKGGRKATQLIFAVIGLVVALPVLAAVLALLMQSDANFSLWMNRLSQSFVHINVWTFVWQFILGLPIAAYLFALMYGNARRLRTATINRQSVKSAADSVSRIVPVALATPTAVLCVMYGLFFVAMGSYLFSAFSAHLPAQYTYAEYARRGFFELSVVAAINLAVLGFTYLFVKRANGVYPLSARILGGVLSGLTLLLIATAVSKMVLYVNQLGLTRLRLYTLCFMMVLFVVFVLVGLWHIRPFRAGAPVIVLVAFSFLVMTWANTDGLIAGYNVSRYLDGRQQTIDARYLGQSLSTAAVPALIELRDQATDAQVRQNASDALDVMHNHGLQASIPWVSWNWQWAQAQQLAPR